MWLILGFCFIAGQCFADELNQRPHIGQHCLLASVWTRREDANVYFTEPADVLIKKGFVFETLTDRCREADKLTEFCCISIHNNRVVADEDNIFNIGLPHYQKLQKFPFACELVGASVEPTSVNSTGQPTAENGCREGNVRDGYQWWEYVLAFLLSFLVIAISGTLPAVIKEFKERREFKRFLAQYDKEHDYKPDSKL